MNSSEQKTSYEKLPDEALLQLYAESEELTPEAREDLMTVITERRLLDDQVAHLQNKLHDVSDAIVSEITGRKSGGQYDEMILSWLVYKGFSEAEIEWLIKRANAFFLEKARDAESARMGAFIRFCCGAALFLIAWLTNGGNAVYFLSLMLLGLSTVQAAIADSRRSRFRHLIISYSGGSQNEEATVADAPNS